MAKGEKKKNVNTPCIDYDEWLDEVELPMALMGGTRAMQDAGTTYLAQEEEESSTSYNNRKERSILLNVFKRTIHKMSGEVFAKDIGLNDDVSEDIKELMEDVDLEGRNLTRFCRPVFSKALGEGVVHVLVDYPTLEIQESKSGAKQFYDEETETWLPLTQDKQKEKGFRPYWIVIPGENLIGWRGKIVNGKYIMTQLRIREQTEEEDGEWGTKTVLRVRVLEPGKYTIYIKSDEEGKNDWIEERSGLTTLDFIPFVSFIPGEEMTKLTAMSPLDDLAWLNLMHWQSSSDQRNILHFARLVIYFGKMLDEAGSEDTGQLIIGPNRMIHTGHEKGDFKIVEPQGNSIESGRQDLQDLEKQMALFGLTYMMPKTGTVTATERALDTSENDSALKSWAVSFEDFINVLIDYTGIWLEKQPGESGTCNVNREFRTFLRDVEPKILLEGFTKLLLSRRLVFEEFKRRDLVRSEEDFADVLAEIENDARTSAGNFEELGGTFLGAGGETF